MRVHPKIQFLEEIHEKEDIGGMAKKGRLGQLADLRGGLPKKKGVTSFGLRVGKILKWTLHWKEGINYLSCKKNEFVVNILVICKLICNIHEVFL